MKQQNIVYELLDPAWIDGLMISSVVGYDDGPIMEAAFSPVTTIRPPFFEMGQEFARLLCDCLAGHAVPEQTVLAGRLIIRQSCGCLDPVLADAATGVIGNATQALPEWASAHHQQIIVRMADAVGATPDAHAWAKQLLMACAAPYHQSETMLSAVERASKAVFALRTCAREEQTPNARQLTDIPNSLDVILARYQNQLKQGVEVIKHYAEVPEIACYPEDLKQVWMHLILNAIQSMGGTGRLEIRVTHPLSPSLSEREGAGG